MTTETERNRQLLTEAFAALETGDPGKFLPLFAPDISWTVMGTSAWSKKASGLAEVERELMGPLFARFTGPYRNIPELVLADGDRVVVLARGEAPTVHGTTYANNYCFIFRLRDGQIVDVREYMDTKLADAVLGA